MRAVILGNGKINDYAKTAEMIRPDDYIICADGGYNHTERLGISADLIIGDFDSIKHLPEGIEKVKYPVRKDLTDGEFALLEAEKRNPERILMFGFCGDRADHMLTNILMLAEHTRASMADEKNEIFALTDKVEINGKCGKTLSIIPIKGDIDGITTEGLEYPLFDESLHFGKSRGVSNVIISDKCVISRKNGIGIIVINDGE